MVIIMEVKKTKQLKLQTIQKQFRTLNYINLHFIQTFVEI